MVNVPCSHAAHYESPTSRSYRDSWTEDIHHNYQRVAEVWLGPYKKYFYENFPHLKVGHHSEKNMFVEICRIEKRFSGSICKSESQNYFVFILKSNILQYCLNTCLCFTSIQDKDPGDLTHRLSIMKQCKRSFHWLLQNVIPQLGLPDVDSIAYGGVSKFG